MGSVFSEIFAAQSGGLVSGLARSILRITTGNAEGTIVTAIVDLDDEPASDEEGKLTRRGTVTITDATPITYRERVDLRDRFVIDGLEWGIDHLVEHSAATGWLTLRVIRREGLSTKPSR